MDTQQSMAQGLVGKQRGTRQKERDLPCHMLSCAAWSSLPHWSDQAPQLFPRMGSDGFLHKESMGKNYHVFWPSSIKAGRDVGWDCGTTSVSLFRWRLGLFLLKVMLCWMGHRNQPDISHHAFNFRRESMTQLLSGHGIRIPGYLEKNYKLWELWQGGWKHQPCLISALFKQWAV